jgi:hypothetical protein
MTLARGIPPAFPWQMQRRSAGARCALRQRVRHCRVPSRCTCWSGRVASCYLAAASRSMRACAAFSRGAAPPNFAFTAITGAPPGRVACELSGLRCLFAPSLTHCVFLCAEDARCVTMAWSAPRRTHDARSCAAGRREGADTTGARPVFCRPAAAAVASCCRGSCVAADAPRAQRQASLHRSRALQPPTSARLTVSARLQLAARFSDPPRREQRAGCASLRALRSLQAPDACRARLASARLTKRCGSAAEASHAVMSRIPRRSGMF